MKITTAVLLTSLTRLAFSLQASSLQLPIEQSASGVIRQGFNEWDHRAQATWALDIDFPQGTAIIAPADGYVLYDRYANGGFAAGNVNLGQQVSGCPLTDYPVYRDDDLDSQNALWVLTYHNPSTGQTWTILHVSEQTLSNQTLGTVIHVTAGQVLGKTGGVPGTPGRGCSNGAHIHIEQLSAFYQGMSPASAQSIPFDLVAGQKDSSGALYMVTIPSADLWYSPENGTFPAFYRRVYGTMAAGSSPHIGGNCGGSGVGACSSNALPWWNGYYRNQFNTFVVGPISVVHQWGPGCIQDFQAVSPGVHDALMQPNCAGTVWQVYGGVWTRYEQLGGAPIIGYPGQDRLHIWSSVSGWAADVQSFQSATFVLHTDQQSWERNQTIAVQGAIRDQWVALGGYSSFLGLPLTNEYTCWYDLDWWSGQSYRVQRTDFEGGYILWHERDRSVEVQSWRW